MDINTYFDLTMSILLALTVVTLFLIFLYMVYIREKPVETAETGK